jgi:hypothetical protein
VLIEDLNNCFPEKLFQKTRRKAAACRLPNPSISTISDLLLRNLAEKAKIRRIVVQSEKFCTCLSVFAPLR